MISSSEVRRRISKNTITKVDKRDLNDIMDIQIEKQEEAIHESKEYGGIIGLVTKNTFEYIKKNNLY